MISRRALLRLGAGVAGCSWLTGCDRAPGGAAGGLRVAAASTGAGIDLDPMHPVPGPGLIALVHLYDPLVRLEGASYRLLLAQRVDRNPDATRWVLRVRPGVRFHDGRPVRPADVAYSLRRQFDPRFNPLATTNARYVDRAGIDVLGPDSVLVPLHLPRGDFVEAILAPASMVFPEGTSDFASGVGAGPFQLDTEGSTTVTLRRNPGYWGPRPEVERLEIIEIDDPVTRLNALVSGQIDYAVGVSPLATLTTGADAPVRFRRGGPQNSIGLTFEMNQDVPPFDRPQVREAVRLAADRDALVRTALLGTGSVGNDVIGRGLPGYLASLPSRARDLATARSLFAEAGVSELTVHAADLHPSLVLSTRLFAQQLEEAGVRVAVRVWPPTAYLGNPARRADRPFRAFYYFNRPAGVHLALQTGRDSAFNFDGQPPGYQDQLDSAMACADPTTRDALFGGLQRQLWDRGGQLVWGFAEQLDAAWPGVGPVSWSQSTPLFTAPSGRSGPS